MMDDSAEILFLSFLRTAIVSSWDLGRDVRFPIKRFLSAVPTHFPFQRAECRPPRLFHEQGRASVVAHRIRTFC